MRSSRLSRSTPPTRRSASAERGWCWSSAGPGRKGVVSWRGISPTHLPLGSPPDEVVVVYTEEGGPTPGDRYPAGVREIDFAALVEGMEEPEDAETALVVLLRTFQADAIVNIDSATLFRALQTYGRALSASERVFLCFFCNEEDAAGPGGARAFATLPPLRAGGRGDHRQRAGRYELSETHHLPASQRHRLHVMKVPVDAGPPFVSQAPTEKDRRPQVFSAGPGSGRRGSSTWPPDAGRRLPHVGRDRPDAGTATCPRMSSSRAGMPTSPRSHSPRPTPGSTPPGGTACPASSWRWA